MDLTAFSAFPFDSLRMGGVLGSVILRYEFFSSFVIGFLGDPDGRGFDVAFPLSGLKHMGNAFRIQDAAE